MTWNRLKKAVAGTALMFTLLLGSGALLATTAQAQNRDRNWRDRDDRRDRDRDWERRRQAERAREWERQRELERLRNRRVYNYPYSYPRTYPSYGGYGGGYGRGGGYNSYDEQKGFRDGLDRGQEDARDRRSPTPNNSEHFRNGNAAYRAGFARGYQQGYRQYGGYRRF